MDTEFASLVAVSLGAGMVVYLVVEGLSAALRHIISFVDDLTTGM